MTHNQITKMRSPIVVASLECIRELHGFTKTNRRLASTKEQTKRRRAIHAELNSAGRRVRSLFRRIARLRARSPLDAAHKLAVFAEAREAWEFGDLYDVWPILESVARDLRTMPLPGQQRAGGARP